jgi:hypothetical protein
MTVRIPGRRTAPQRGPDGSADPLTTRLHALDRVVELGEGRLDEELLAPARALAHRAVQRLRLSGRHTVVALAGATGSGKSSLFKRAGWRRSRRPACAARPPTSRTPRSGTPQTRVRCWTGWTSPGATRSTSRRARTTCADWYCSTCPTTTPRSWRTASRSIDCSPWWTCWCGCATRRSTPTPRSTTATSNRWPVTAR